MCGLTVTILSRVTQCVTDFVCWGWVQFCGDSSDMVFVGLASVVDCISDMRFGIIIKLPTHVWECSKLVRLAPQSCIPNWGRRLHTFILIGSQDWAASGFYSVEVEKRESGGWIVKLRHSLLQRTVTLDGDVTGADSGFDSFGVVNNYSQTRAVLRTKADDWLCSNFSPC